MLTVHMNGNFSNTNKFLQKLKRFQIKKILSHYGDEGVAALSNATPVDSGLTADSWYYEIFDDADGVGIRWNNRNTNKGVNIALILQYGHGTRNGGYVTGIDYINPALKPIFDQIVEDVWSEVRI